MASSLPVWRTIVSLSVLSHLQVLPVPPPVPSPSPRTQHTHIPLAAIPVRKVGARHPLVTWTTVRRHLTTARGHAQRAVTGGRDTRRESLGLCRCISRPGSPHPVHHHHDHQPHPPVSNVSPAGPSSTSKCCVWGGVCGVGCLSCYCSLPRVRES